MLSLFLAQFPPPGQFRGSPPHPVRKKKKKKKPACWLFSKKLLALGKYRPWCVWEGIWFPGDLKGHPGAGSSSLPTGASGYRCCSWVRSTITVSIFGVATMIQKEVSRGKRDPPKEGKQGNPGHWFVTWPIGVTSLPLATVVPSIIGCGHMQIVACFTGVQLKWGNINRRALKCILLIAKSLEAIQMSNREKSLG